jgi:hypothetical protein
MPRFKFIGDPRDNFSGPEVLRMFGRDFPRDKWVDVDEGEICEKLESHTHFDADFAKELEAAPVREIAPDNIASDGSEIAEPIRRKRGPKKGWKKLLNA